MSEQLSPVHFDGDDSGLETRTCSLFLRCFGHPGGERSVPWNRVQPALKGSRHGERQRRKGKPLSLISRSKSPALKKLRNTFSSWEGENWRPTWLFLCYKENGAASFWSPEAPDSGLSLPCVDGDPRDPRDELGSLLWPGEAAAFLRTETLTFSTVDIIQVQYLPGLKKEPPERTKNSGFTNELKENLQRAGSLETGLEWIYPLRN